METTTTSSDSWEKNISGVIYRWDNFPGTGVWGVGQFSLGYLSEGNNVGDKSSKRQFSSEAITRRILSGVNYL